MFKKILSILIFIILTGCFDEKPQQSLSAGRSPKTMFNQAKELVEQGDIEKAIILFDRIQAVYPSSKYSKQSLLERAYAFYKDKQFARAIIEAEQYIKIYPNDDGTVYAYYLKALSAEEKSASFLTDFLTDQALLDANSTVRAYQYYLDLVEKYPFSHYAIKSKQKIIELNNSLARRELYVAIFYTKRKAHIAAVNRAKYIIENYSTSSSIPGALVLLIRNYKEMGLINLADDAQRVLDKNYPTYKPSF